MGRATLARWGLCLVLVVLSAQAATRAGATRGETAYSEVEYLPSVDVLRLGAVGYDEVLADLMWFRAIQYYGEWRKGEHGMRFFEALATSTVELDPYFEDAYRFTAMVLAEDMGQSALGIEFLKKGMRNLPESWWLPFEAGFIEYTQNQNDLAAADWFQIAADTPGATDYPRRFAAFASGRSGDLQVSLELWNYVMQTSDNEALRAKAADYVQQLDVALQGGPIPLWAVRPRPTVPLRD